MQTPSPSRTTKTSSSEAWQCTGQLSLPGGMCEWLSPVSNEPAAAPSSRELSPNPPRSRSSGSRSEEHTSELQSRQYLVCRLLLEKTKNSYPFQHNTTY